MSQSLEIEEGIPWQLSSESSHHGSNSARGSSLALDIERPSDNSKLDIFYRYIRGILIGCHHIVHSNRLFPNFRPQKPCWNWVFLIFCVIAITVDPLFFYIPIINDHKKCLQLDKKLGIVVIFLRSFLDFVHIIYIIFQFRTDSFAPCLGYPRRNLNEISQEITRKYLSRFFPIDLLAILPLPQMLILIIIPLRRGSEVSNAMKFLRFFVIIQHVPRVFRMYPLFTKVTRTSRKLEEATLTKAAFNLLLYMIASHAFGALWYFIAIEREIVCWKRACKNHTGCSYGSFYCHDHTLGNNTFLNDFCPTKLLNTTIFDFGIFGKALQSGIVEVTDFPQKFLYCFLWGLQNLSCFGQNLETSSYVWESFFAIVITITGVVLFLSVIGNIQIFLPSKTIRTEEMRLKGREIEQWMGFRKLSPKLQAKVRKYRQYVWRETRGVNVENVLNNFPKDLKKDIKGELGLELLMNVPLFKDLDTRSLVEICAVLKPVLYTEESDIMRKGDGLDAMIFVMEGRLRSATTNCRRTRFCYLNAGDYCGEELLMWALDPQSTNVPISTKTVRAPTEVEAFALMAADLKIVACILASRLTKKQLCYAYKYYSQCWRNWAACFVQAAWRSHRRKKLEESLQAEEIRLQDECVEVGGSSSSFGAVIYPSRILPIPALLFPKPAEPHFLAELEKKTQFERQL